MRRPRTSAPPPIPAAVLLALMIPLAVEGRAQPVGGPVVGTKGSKVYHDLDCGSARRLSGPNRVPFATPGLAEASGFRACRSCEPDEAIRMVSLFAARPPGQGEGEGDDGGEGEDGGPKFSTHVAPALVANCVRCHNADDRRGGFDLSTFRALMAGADSGPVVAPDAPAESELLRRITGEATPKMPPGDTDLAPETIARIEAWIAAGAPLDPGADPGAPISELAASPEQLRALELARLSDDDRRLLLVEAANRRWAQAGAPGEPALAAGDRTLVFGALPEARAGTLSKTLDRAQETARALLSRPGMPALAGPMALSVYVFDDRNHYAEFARTVAGQEPAEGERARADLSGEAPYLAALDPLGGREESEFGEGGTGRGLDALLVEQLGAGAVSAAGAEAPRWLALGYGALLASKLEPRGAEVARLRAGAVRAYQVGWTTKAGEALGDVLDPDETRALGFSLLEWLSAANPRAVGPFVRGMLGGRDRLDDGIQQLFGASREQFLSAWGQWVAARYGRGR
ncbi:c-type cytochrome domain-containing protein [Tautonia plasticadhaerens]|uniref:Planctomycete cytochrome C n=1 Tax=Tautonia plasticadhaerens TaxID=2527974 RepID=A0A518H0H6_9BACT|nr:c-type cytochrome domain-containing protein [Tautonia plasticadhaerens]QDV34321.1 Planctomycete cytochrome C [Tautonia plasticadhaerens]